MIRSLCFAFLLATSSLHSVLAEAGDPLAAIRARQLYLDGHPDLAFATLLRLAQTGDPQAEVALGYFYAKGIGTPVDDAKAVELFERAAQKNHPAAIYNLAVSYEFGGTGLPRDRAKAEALYRRSAALDHAPSMHRLALMYLAGKAVPRDIGLGRALLERAVLSGHPQATADLAQLLFTGGDLPKDLPRARALFLIAAAHGIDKAQRNYGAMLAAGQGGPADPAEAEIWLRRAQAAGNATAGLDLAHLLAANDSPGPDRQVEALAWCLWYDASLPVVIPEDPSRNCIWARTGLTPEDVQKAIAMAKTF